MNLLFANYGDFTTNSTLHIAGFANRLSEAGHDVIVAAPDWLHTLQALNERRFQACTYRQLLDGECHFGNYQSASILHAWTPRQPVMHFARQYLKRHVSTRLLIHLEDNEEHLLEVFCKQPFETLVKSSGPELEKVLPSWMAHPRHYQFFLAAADAATVIHTSLDEFVPPFIPVKRLFPPISPQFLASSDQARPHPAARNHPAATKLIVYPGGLHPVNFPDFAELAAAVESLNRAGIPTALLRTGPDSFNLLPTLPDEVREHLHDLGVVGREEIPALLASADALVQPGGDDAANHYRFPSKFPEFLAAGKPLLAPACHHIDGLIDQENWIALQHGGRVEISERLAELWSEPGRAAALGRAAHAFALQRFSACRNTCELDEFYHRCLQSPANGLRRHWLQIERNHAGALQRFSRRVLEMRSGVCRNHIPAGPWPTPDVRDRLILEFSALDTDATSPSNQLETSSLSTTTVKIYPEIDGDFQETHALAQRAHPGQWLRLSFQIECASPCPMQRIRIDPGETPGLIRLAECKIEAGAKRLYYANSRRGFAGIRVCGTAVETTRERSLDLFSIGNDPSLVVALAQPLKAVQDLTVTIRLFILPLPESYHGTETLHSLQKRLVIHHRDQRKKRRPFWNR